MSLYATFAGNNRGGSGGGVIVYANLAAFPALAPNGTLAVDGSTHILYEFNSTSVAWEPIASNAAYIAALGGILSIGPIDTGTPSANGAQIVANALIMQSASATVPGLVNDGVQTFAGNKTFTGTIAASNFSGSSSGTNTGDVTLTAVGSTPNANGAALTGQALTLEPASASFPGIITTASQSFAGLKTFGGLTNSNMLPSVNHVVWVSHDGNDSAGDGSFLNPYQTIAHAYTTITTATSANLYAIRLKSSEIGYDVSASPFFFMAPNVFLMGESPQSVYLTGVPGTIISLNACANNDPLTYVGLMDLSIDGNVSVIGDLKATGGTGTCVVDLINVKMDTLTSNLSIAGRSGASQPADIVYMRDVITGNGGWQNVQLHMINCWTNNNWTIGDQGAPTSGAPFSYGILVTLDGGLAQTNLTIESGVGGSIAYVSANLSSVFDVNGNLTLIGANTSAFTNSDSVGYGPSVSGGARLDLGTQAFQLGYNPTVATDWPDLTHFYVDSIRDALDLIGVSGIVKTQAANTVLAGPTTGAAAKPAFRALVAADIPGALTNTLTNAHIFVGNASNVATDVAVSGDVTIANTGATAIGTNKVTNAQLAQAPALTIKGNNTGGTANELDLTVAQVNAMLGDILANGTVAFGANQSFGGFNATNLADPTTAQMGATKAYVDASVAALQPLASVYAATTANIAGTYLNGVAGIGATFTTTATGVFTVDGVTPPLNSRILIKDQSSGFQNGVYTLTTAGSIGVSAIFTRTLDYDTAGDMNAAGLIPVINGTTNALSSWQQVAIITTVGTDALVFTEFTANPSLYLLKANNLSDVASASTSFNNLSPMTTLGDLIYGGASGAGTRVGIGSAGQVLTVSGGLPVWSTPAAPGTGTVTSVALTVPTFLSVAGSPITTAGTFAVTLSGTALPVANGGTGQTTASNAFNALSPMTTGGDVIYGGASGVGTRLANGSAGQVLTSAGTTLAPTWTTPATGTVTSVALTVPGFLSVAGSPVTSTGTLAVTLATQTANTVFAGPASGGAATPTFRALNVADQTIAAQAISATTIDWSTGNMFTKTLGANTTFTFSNNISGQTIVVRLTNTASNYTVTWPTVRWAGGTPPTMTIGAFSDVYTFIYDGSNIYGSVVQNMS